MHFADASLSRVCFVTFMPLLVNHTISLLYAVYMSPDYLVFMGFYQD